MSTTRPHSRTSPQARALATTAWPIWIAVILTALTVLSVDIAGRMHIGSPTTLLEQWLPHVDAP